MPLLKAPICDINALGAQELFCMFILCLTSLKMAVSLHKAELSIKLYHQIVLSN